MKKERKAVALFVTLGILSLISLMIMNAFSFMTKNFKHVENIEKINQTKVVISDFQDVLSVITKEIKDADILYQFIGAYPPISDEDGLFSLSFEMKSLSKAININLIIEDKNSSTPDIVPQIKEIYLPIFEFIFNTYQIRDGELLLNYIADTLDTDSVERDLNTELLLNDTSFLNGLIVNWEQFKQILIEYQNQTDDREVMKVPWQDFFYFSYDKDESMIDCNFMSINLANALELDIYVSGESQEVYSEAVIESPSISCDMIESSENSEKMKIYNIKEFNSSDKYIIGGVVEYSTNAVNDSFKFIYNLKNKRIVDIEVKEISTEDSQ